MQIEPERYELSEIPPYHLEVQRRSFFKALGFGFLIVAVTDAQETGATVRRGGRRMSAPEELGVWLHIGEDGSVTACTGKVEVGQNTRTALTQGVAEELKVPVSAVKVTMGDTDLVPYDMGTFGSRSMPQMLPQIRNAAATARELLMDEAARRLSAARANMTTADGWVRDSQSGQSLSFGEIVQGQELLKTSKIGKAPVTPPERWTVLGRAVPKIDGRSFVTGGHKYTSDLKLSGMIAGQADRPVKANPPLVSSGQPLYTWLKEKGKPLNESTKGSFEEGLAAADQKLSTTYQVAYIAHAPLEPRAALAQWSGEKLTVWTGTQVPFGVKTELAKALGIPEANIRVIVPDTGSGYGGKHTGEAAVAAARQAKAAGKPVKIVWTREEEFSYAYFRPAGVIDVQSGVKKNGTLTAWEFHNYNSGASALETLYDVPHQKVHFHSSESPLRQGSYRGLAATANNFAREVHMDEAARAIGKDSLEFRLHNLKDERLRAVLQRAAEKFGWSGKPGTGLAGGFDKGGYVATFAEVAADRDLKNVRVIRVVTAFECGAIVNPNTLRNQVEGAVIMGLGGALTEEVQFEGTRILNARFSRYRVPRFRDIPLIETVLVDRRDLPSAGAGEAPIIGIAPAIGNAIFSATGIRLRSMPMLPGQSRS